MTDTTHFKPVITALETNLAAWTHFYCDWENITLGTLPPPSLALGHNPMKIILMPPSPLICLHPQICMHSRTIHVIKHLNLMVPLLNHRGHLLPPCHMPQPSQQATLHPARFLKKLSIRLHKKTPIAVSMLMNSLLKFPPYYSSPNTH